jgi:hypothetical protein
MSNFSAISWREQVNRLRGGLSHIEGPLGGSGSGIFSSMQSSDGSINATGQNSISLRGNYDTNNKCKFSFHINYCSEVDNLSVLSSSVLSSSLDFSCMLGIGLTTG